MLPVQPHPSAIADSDALPMQAIISWRELSEEQESRQESEEREEKQEGGSMRTDGHSCVDMSMIRVIGLDMDLGMGTDRELGYLTWGVTVEEPEDGDCQVGEVTWVVWVCRAVYEALYRTNAGTSTSRPSSGGTVTPVSGSGSRKAQPAKVSERKRRLRRPSSFAGFRPDFSIEDVEVVGTGVGKHRFRRHKDGSRRCAEEASLLFLTLPLSIDEITSLLMTCASLPTYVSPSAASRPRNDHRQRRRHSGLRWPECSTAKLLGLSCNFLLPNNVLGGLRISVNVFLSTQNGRVNEWKDNDNDHV
ncbi:hypothetical protein AAF712_015177 [Marasmius tenuissimus]|uniref:Uncharacterized protein n=1 Tax=Marasmius tenuissimus TaxID=585030 RepID=A0ABR2ZA29_9AGAR